jgi:hypothetical protein
LAVSSGNGSGVIDSGIVDRTRNVPQTSFVRANFRLTTTDLDFWVDVRLRSVDDRWIAVAEISGDHEIGLGGSAPEALGSALASLGEEAAAALLADPQLLGVGRKER